jgi:hypothetical protein
MVHTQVTCCRIQKPISGERRTTGSVYRPPPCPLPCPLIPPTLFRSTYISALAVLAASCNP